MGNILVNVKKHGFNLEEELWIGLWVGYVTELLDTPWSGCFATSTAKVVKSTSTTVIKQSASIKIGIICAVDNVAEIFYYLQPVLSF